MKRTGRVMQIIVTILWTYKFCDEYPFKYDKNWILLILMWGLNIMIVQFFIDFAKDLDE